MEYPQTLRSPKKNTRTHTHTHEPLFQLKCGLFYNKITCFGCYFIVYWQNSTQVNIFKHFSAVFHTFDVKYVTFRELVLGHLSPDFVYVYINRIETNYPVCCLYHYKPVCGFSFVSEKNSKIRKEYLGTGC